ncbi:hypothetical protein BD413DRAFT_600199 [Trametes elegans]|nr:hypothetical protein BD413DRAFT_600199 [Trametes elegans]
MIPRLSLLRHAPAHPGCKLHWDADADSGSELALAAQELSSADFVMKPNELHLAFDIGPLHSRGFSRFKRLDLRRPAHTHSGRPYPPRHAPGALSRSSTASSAATFTLTLTADAGVLLTRHVRRESTCIVWGGALALELDPPGAVHLPLRRVLVKIAVDDEGAEDLRDHARHYEALAERGLYVGYYGVFVDKLGSTALVVEDLGDGDESPRSGSL